MTRQDASETLRQCEAVVAEARAFFLIDPLYQTPVRAEQTESAEIDFRPGYFFSVIMVNLDYFQKNPQLIRESMAHEVAHLASAELMAANALMPTEWQYGGDTPSAGIWTHALEALTTRLTRLFMRERPEGPAP